MVVHAFNPSTCDVETKGFCIRGQPGLHIETLTEGNKLIR